MVITREKKQDYVVEEVPSLSSAFLKALVHCGSQHTVITSKYGEGNPEEDDAVPVRT